MSIAGVWLAGTVVLKDQDTRGVYAGMESKRFPSRNRRLE